MLTLAIQKSGRLHEGSMELLKSCGIHIQNGGRQLRTRAINFPLEIYYLRNSDIPGYLEDDIANAAILGQNELEEQGADLKEEIPLGFSQCRLSIAVPKNDSFNGLQDLNGKRIATSYPKSLQRFLTQEGISASVHTISG